MTYGLSLRLQNNNIDERDKSHDDLSIDSDKSHDDLTINNIEKLQRTQNFPSAIATQLPLVLNVNEQYIATIKELIPDIEFVEEEIQFNSTCQYIKKTESDKAVQSPIITT